MATRKSTTRRKAKPSPTESGIIRTLEALDAIAEQQNSAHATSSPALGVSDEGTTEPIDSHREPAGPPQGDRRYARLDFQADRRASA